MLLLEKFYLSIFVCLLLTFITIIYVYVRVCVFYLKVIKVHFNCFVISVHASMCLVDVKVMYFYGPVKLFKEREKKACYLVNGE